MMSGYGRMIVAAVLCIIGMARSDEAVSPSVLERFKPELDKLVSPYLKIGWIQGLVVGVIDGDESRVWGYGRVSADADRPPDGKTIFEIGSISKLFTILLLVDRADKKAVRPEDPVSKFLPAELPLLRFEGRDITLGDLANHRSGLPRDPGNWSFGSAAGYGDEKLHEFLRALKLSRGPGGAPDYSNLGFGLLGHVLARQVARSYEELLREVVTSPLGMKNTGISLTAEQQERFAPAHDPDGRRVPHFACPALSGAGSIRSTADDMITLMKACITAAHPPKSGVLSVYLAKEAPKTVFEFPGATIGHHAYWTVDTARQRGVVVLSNTGSFIVTPLGQAIAARLADRPADPRLALYATFVEKSVDPAVLKRRVGTYRLPASPYHPREHDAVVTLEGEHLVLSVAEGTFKMTLLPYSGMEFVTRLDPGALLSFREEGNEVKGFQWKSWMLGHDLFALRLQ